MCVATQHRKCCILPRGKLFCVCVCEMFSRYSAVVSTMLIISIFPLAKPAVKYVDTVVREPGSLVRYQVDVSPATLVYPPPLPTPCSKNQMDYWCECVSTVYVMNWCKKCEGFNGDTVSRSGLSLFETHTHKLHIRTFKNESKKLSLLI